ncbi:hypothetical protein F0562_002141 [Nyssa sinensis]|uniref:Uncharacterized protein n=1 Tax=Nyssa sinensis TaxID=561372 RepID=A0A5J5C8X0_9ASTE|nr:hypothetical protein F0562_002141 [Nyssa sinensis]
MQGTTLFQYLRIRRNAFRTASFQSCDHSYYDFKLRTSFDGEFGASAFKDKDSVIKTFASPGSNVSRLRGGSE